MSTHIIQALESFVFSPEDYYLHFADTTRDAINHVMRETGYDQRELPVGLISEILRARLISMLSVKAEWLLMPVHSESVISCKIDGTLFRGNAHIEPKKVRVSLENENSTKECILHQWAPAIFTEDPISGSNASRDGEECAKELFLEICGEAQLKYRIFASEPKDKQ